MGNIKSLGSCVPAATEFGTSIGGNVKNIMHILLTPPPKKINPVRAEPKIKPGESQT